MSRSKDFDLPRGDRDEVDEPIRPEPEIPLTVPPPPKGQGLGSWLAGIDAQETRDQMIRRLDQQDPARFLDFGERTRKVDQAMAWTAAGLCGHCGQSDCEREDS